MAQDLSMFKCLNISACDCGEIKQTNCFWLHSLIAMFKTLNLKHKTNKFLSCFMEYTTKDAVGLTVYYEHSKTLHNH